MHDIHDTTRVTLTMRYTHLINDVSTGHDKRGERRCGDGRHGGVAALVKVDLAMPPSPHLGRGEHATYRHTRAKAKHKRKYKHTRRVTDMHKSKAKHDNGRHNIIVCALHSAQTHTSTAHVSEGTLSGAASTTSRNTRNTGDGTSGTPRLGGRLVTSLLVDGVCLALVLVHVGVHKRDDIRTDGRLEDSREDGGAGLFPTCGIEDCDLHTTRHAQHKSVGMNRYVNHGNIGNLMAASARCTTLTATTHAREVRLKIHVTPTKMFV